MSVAGNCERLEAKRALGETLFHDVRLSIDNSRSCASCHERAIGFADAFFDLLRNQFKPF